MLLSVCPCTAHWSVISAKYRLKKNANTNIFGKWFIQLVQFEQNKTMRNFLISVVTAYRRRVIVLANESLPPLRNIWCETIQKKKKRTKAKNPKSKNAHSQHPITCAKHKSTEKFLPKQKKSDSFTYAFADKCWKFQLFDDKRNRVQENDQNATWCQRNKIICFHHLFIDGQRVLSLSH